MPKLSRKAFCQEIEGVKFPGAFPAKFCQEALHYQALPTDIILSTFPKCGTTWTQTILLLIFRKGEPLEGTFTNLFVHSPFLEMTGVKAAQDMIRPGAIKVHLAYQNTPYNKDAKYIYVSRNPRDACVSFFYHSKMPLHMLEGCTWDEYFEIFVNGENEYGDYFDHLLSWWEHRKDPNVLFITYEEMKADQRGAILKFAKFLGPEFEKSVGNKDVMQNILKYSSFEYMKKTINPELKDFFKFDVENAPYWIKEFGKNLQMLMAEGKVKMDENSGTVGEEAQFIRKGIVGDWKNHFNEDQLLRMDERFREKTKGVDLSELVDIWKKHGAM